jgi:hypothetical protein
MILQSFKRIPIEDMEHLLNKHEADAGNFDRRIAEFVSAKKKLTPDKTTVRISRFF